MGPWIREDEDQQQGRARAKDPINDGVLEGSLMKVSCRACASSRVVDAQLVSRGFFGLDPLVLEGPVASAFSGRCAQSTVSAQVCVDCGAIELHALDLKELRRIYASLSQAGSLGLNA